MLCQLHQLTVQLALLASVERIVTLWLLKVVEIALPDQARLSSATFSRAKEQARCRTGQALVE